VGGALPPASGSTAGPSRASLPAASGCHPAMERDGLTRARRQVQKIPRSSTGATDLGGGKNSRWVSDRHGIQNGLAASNLRLLGRKPISFKHQSSRP
jgi:hypothetical protein